MKRSFLLSITLLLFSTFAAAQINLNLGSDSPMRKMQMAEIAISNFYVDEVDEQKVVEDAIRGMLKGLDPHSTYTDAKETKAMNEPLQGDFEGIGVQFNIIDDTLVVIQTVVNGPSEKVGIVSGDRIVMVDDTLIAGVKMNRTDIMKRLRGKKGTKVKLGIVRRDVKGILNFIVTRAKIPVHTLNAAYMIRPGIGYARLESFGMKTHEELMEAVEKLKQQGMQRLILDLQDNGGGFLEAAVRIANEFLQDNDMIVYTEGRRVSRQSYKARGNGRLKDIPVYVLVNELSASAAEIVSGAIMDNDRGTIIGRRTFGKGLVQRPFELADGSMIRLTVAHYYIPSGRCIQKPYKKGENLDYAMDIEKRFEHGELYSADSIHFADSLKYQTLRQHRTVYGGGGVMPDYFVPLDTTLTTRFHRQLLARSFIINANLSYVDAHRKELKKRYPTFDTFLRDFEVPQSVIDNIVAEAAKQNVKPKDEAELKATMPALRAQLKALVARDLWDMSEYFHIINERNAIVKKALTLF